MNLKEDLICEQCNRRFKYERHYWKHWQTHNTHVLMCAYCYIIFDELVDLELHLCKAHAGDQPFKCEVCSKTFKTKYHFEKHFRTHTGERPYSCVTCDKRFSQYCNLKTHKLTHTGEKPYACHICAKCFTQNRNLRRHMLAHPERKTWTYF